MSHVTIVSRPSSQQTDNRRREDGRAEEASGYFYNERVKTRGQFCVILSGVKSLFWSETGLDQSYYVCHGRLVPAPGTRMRGLKCEYYYESSALCETLLLVVDLGDSAQALTR